MIENGGNQQEYPKDELQDKPGTDYLVNQIMIWVVIASLLVLLIKKFF